MQTHVFLFDFVEWEQTDGSLIVSFCGSDTATAQTFEFLEDAPFFLLFLPDFKVFRLLWNIDNRYSWLRHGWSFRRRFLTGNFQKEVLRWGEQQALVDFQNEGLSEGYSSLERTSEIGGVSEGGLKLLMYGSLLYQQLKWAAPAQVSRISWGYFSDFSQYALDHDISDGAGEDGLALVTLKEIMLRFWEALFKRGREGSSQKPCRMQGTTSITSSCAVSSLMLCASWCFSFRIWM